jgi:isocitrate lyase
MGVPGIIVARTDAESATLLESRSDERDQPFVLGATRIELPSYKTGYIAIWRKLFELGVEEIRGHLLYDLSDLEYQQADEWLASTGLLSTLEEKAKTFQGSRDASVEGLLNEALSDYVDLWQAEAGLETYADAVADVIEFRTNEGEQFELTTDRWREFAKKVSYYEARERAKALGIHIIWDCEHSRSPEGFYQIQGGIDYAIAKSLAVAPFADLLWMETKTADLEDAKTFAAAIHAEYPDKMLAYNLSPSFNWDTTGMSDEEMTRYPQELGKMGFVFNFITYGGHQIDGLAAEEFATALKEDGMLALARLQRKFRWPRRVARRPPRRWGRARPSSSISSRPRCRESCSKSGSGCGPSTTISHPCVSSCGRRLRPPTCWSSASSTGRMRRWPMSSLPSSRTAAGGTFSRYVTRTPSRPSCAGSDS